MSQDAPHDRAPGRRRAAWLLSLLSPGLGLVYAGRPLRGVAVNLALVLLTLGVVIAVTWWNLVVAWAALATLLAWVLITALSALSASEIAEQNNSHPRRAYQHPLLYEIGRAHV